MSQQKVINFMGLRRLAVGLSLLLVLLSLGSLAVKGLQFGLDFTGGALIELEYDRPADLGAIRSQLREAGYENAIVQDYGSAQDVVIRMPGDDPQLGQRVADQLGADYSGAIELRRVEFVGPQVGEELREQGGIGMIVALILIMLYIAFRFQYKFALGAILALAHDVIITLGVFSFLGLQFDLTVLAAVLSVIGYSLNDTIVVFDRVRENFRRVRTGGLENILNVSLTQTLGRTLMTSGTTLLVLISLFLFGGEMIHNFSSALIIGIFVGTYSSIYVASSLLQTLNLTREDMLPPEKKEGEEEEVLP